ncbi:MAG TPA: hypothetical protein VGG58_10565 [Candidatus Acidoferrum sp.]
MQKKGGLLIALVLIATGALRFMSPGGAAPPAAPQAASQSESAKKEKGGPAPAKQRLNPSLGAGALDLSDTIEAFFGVYREAPSGPIRTACGDVASEQDLIAHWNVPTCKRSQVRFLLALAPDPVHTELNLFFDRGVETIQQAAQEEGYDFDRATMPWDSSTHPESNDFQKREDEEAVIAARESLPGLMIFRPAQENRAQPDQGQDSDQDQQGPLFVFVVGETPTAGIHKNQFTSALQIMCEIHGGCPAQPPAAAKEQKPAGALANAQGSTRIEHVAHSSQAVLPKSDVPLLILGPSSSGSLYSLSRALDLDRNLIGDARRVFVFSGSARGTSQACWFRQSVRPNVRFVPFQEGEDSVIRRFLEFTIEGRGYKPQDTAVLSEDETSYGYSSPPVDKDSKPENGTDPRCALGYGPYDGGSIDKDDNASHKHDSPLLKLQFPRGISHFRAAYQKFVGVTVPPQDSSGGRAVLPLDLQATGSEDDSVASYAKIQFPLSQEAVMLGIVARLRDKHPKFVILRASDAVDQLFLTRYLRQNYPEGRVVVTAPDLLYAREDDGLLHGVLGISAYSLVPEINRFLCHPIRADHKTPRSQRAFPGSSDQGVYNAMVSLLAISKSPHTGDRLFAIPPSRNPADLPPAHYSGYGNFEDWRFNGDSSASCELAPQLWITMLARDGYWMTATLLRDTSSSLHAVNDEGHTPHPGIWPATPKPWIFFFSFVVLLLSVHAWLVCYGTIFSGSEIKARFGPVEDPHAKPNQNGNRNTGRNGHRKAGKPEMPFVDTEAARRDVRESESLGSRTRRARLLAWGAAALASIALLLLGTRYAAISERECFLLTFGLMLLPLSLTYWVCWNLHFRGESGIAVRLSVGITVLALSVFSPWFGPRYWLTSLTAYRSMHMLSGVSPLLPILFLIGAAYCMSWYELQAVAVTDVRRPRLPRCADLPRDYFRVSEEDQEDLRKMATSLSLSWRVFGPVLLLLTPFVLLTIDIHNFHPVQTFEGRNYDWMYFFLVLLWVVLFLGCLSRLMWVWNECRRFLSGLDNLPLRDAFRNLQDFSWSLIWAPTGSALRDSFKYVSRELQSLRRLQTAVQADLASSHLLPEFPVQNGRGCGLRAVKTQIDRSFSLQARALREFDKIAEVTNENPEALEKIASLMDTFGELQQQLAKTAGAVLKCFLGPSWREDVLPVASDLPKDWKNKPDDKTPMELVAEEFVSLVYANFLTSVLLRIRTLVLEAIGIFLFLLFSISSYPFEPNPDMFTLAVLLISVLGCVVAFVYSQMHRDPALSRLTSTAEGEVGYQFWVQLLSAGAIPVLSLLAVQFPSISRVLTNWIGPALQSIK